MPRPLKSELSRSDVEELEDICRELSADLSDGAVELQLYMEAPDGDASVCCVGIAVPRLALLKLGAQLAWRTGAWFENSVELLHRTPMTNSFLTEKCCVKELDDGVTALVYWPTLTAPSAK